MPTEYTLADWQQAKSDADSAKERLDEITRSLAENMIDAGIKSDIEQVDGVDYKVTVVQKETMKFDENTLLKSLGKRAFSKVSNLKLDNKKLEAAIRDGSIDPELISRNTVISKSNPYLRVTE